MRRLKNLMIGSKIFLAIVGLIVGVAVFMLAYFPRNLTELTLRGVLRESSTMTKLIAFSSTSAIEFEDKKLVAEIFRSAQVNPNLKYLVIYRPDGSTFHALNETAAARLKRRAVKEKQQLVDGNSLSIIEPIRSANETIGYLAAGYDLQEIAAAKNRNLLTILSITAALVVIGGVFAQLIGKIITQPIHAVISGSKEVASGNYNFNIPVTTQDETGTLAQNFNQMTLAVRESRQKIEEKNKEIQTILDNVSFGLLRLNHKCQIKPGYSNSCRALLGTTLDDSLQGRNFLELLNLNKRDLEHFHVMFDQVFDAAYLAEQTVGDIPKLFRVKDKNLEARYFAIFAEDKVESILVVLSDVTDTIRLELENENNKALVKIVQNKSRFRKLVAEIILEQEIERIIEGESGESPIRASDSQKLQEIKRSMHTWKGDFSAFGLKDISKFIHEMEEILLAHNDNQKARPLIEKIRERIQLYLGEHFSVLKLSLSDLAFKTIELREDELEAFHREIMEATDLDAVKQSISSFLERCHSEKAGQVFGYLAECALHAAQMLGKEIQLTIEGENIRLPHAYDDIYSNLIHLVRNAVDHGIEFKEERGAKGPVANLTFSVRETASFFELRISDDGCGIDTRKLGEIAVQKGFIDREQLSKLSKEAIVNFIFVHGFTTLQHVSILSGRGVGLDSLQEAVRRAGGYISVETELGKGTTFLVSLPREVSASLQSSSSDSRAQFPGSLANPKTNLITLRKVD